MKDEISVGSDYQRDWLPGPGRLAYVVMRIVDAMLVMRQNVANQLGPDLMEGIGELGEHRRDVRQAVILPGELAQIAVGVGAPDHVVGQLIHGCRTLATTKQAGRVPVLCIVNLLPRRGHRVFNDNSGLLIDLEILKSYFIYAMNVDPKRSKLGKVYYNQ